MEKHTFIQRANTIHDNKYVYDLVPGTFKVRDKVDILCPTHGVFLQKPHEHLYHAAGCKYCAIEKKQMGVVKFLSLAREIHADNFDYSSVKYVNIFSKVDIICPLHGMFQQTPDVHIYKKCGCPKCKFDKSRSSKEEFIQKAKLIHSSRFDYHKVVYVNSLVKVEIGCKKHGSFWQVPSNHLLRNSGCPKCAYKNRRHYYDKLFELYEYKKIPGLIYLAKFENESESFLKIGITKHDSARKRLGRYKKKDYEITVLLERPCLLSDAFDMEQNIIRDLHEYHYIPKITFPGFTECLRAGNDIIPLIEKRIYTK